MLLVLVITIIAYVARGRRLAKEEIVETEGTVSNTDTKNLQRSSSKNLEIQPSLSNHADLEKRGSAVPIMRVHEF